MDDAARPVYSIGAVARMLSIPPATLRSWEERYGLVVPQRSAGGHRLYSRDQIDQLRFVKAQTVTVHASDAHRLLAERLEAVDVAKVADPAPPPRAAPDGPAILIAERDEYAAGFAEYFLRTEGYDVLRALSVEDARAQLAARPPVLAVVELMISGGVGVDLCRMLKSEMSIPVVAVSSLAARDDALSAGADAFLSKPIDPLELVSAIKDLLGSSAFQRSSPSGAPR
jgi:DNA-binding transcriptional MerR regulator